MSFDSNRTRRYLPLALGIVTLAGVAVLLVWDAAPQFFPARSHDYLASFSLAMIAVAFVVFRLAQRAVLADLAKAVVLAAAFLFWAANQFWPDSPRATLFNDIAIGLFVLDVFFIIAARGAIGKVSRRGSRSASQ